MPDLARARNNMVDDHIAARGVRDTRVLNALREVPRERFVQTELRDKAYDDVALPIGEQQTISQPYVVAVMLEAAELKGRERVLEVGTGSGYAAALISRIAADVYTIERYASLAAQAGHRLQELGYGNIRIRVGDGTLGWDDAAPFDAIIVAAGAPEVPEPLKQQLAIGGRLIMPVGDSDEQQTLVKVTRTGAGSFATIDLGCVHFVRLIGARGWPATEEC